MASDGYTKGTASGSQRDPQLVADPSGLIFDLEDTYPQEYHSAQKHTGAVNPNVVYSHTQQHTVYIPPTAVLREQYCVCAPRTRTERRLLVVVVVLSILSVMLLAGLASVLPMVTCGDDCHQDKNNPGGLLDFLMPSDFVAPVAAL